VSDDQPALGPSADEVPEDGETGSTGGAAVAARPLRPTGKRSRRAAAEPVEATEASDADKADTVESSAKAGNRTKSAKAAKPAGSRVNPVAFVWNYLKQVVAELRKVIWPNRKQMVTYTSVVLVFLTFMVTLIGLTDLGLARLVTIVFG
jgi:preprotein translocase subunit SecE